MNKLLSKKSTRRIIVSVIVVVLLIAIGAFGFLGYKTIKGMLGSNTSSSSNSIDSLGYSLRDDATDYQKELFKELKEAVEKNDDEVEIATLVAENFVADFYTWTNKKGSYDVGGLCYFYSPQKITLYEQARDTFYYYLSHYIGEYGKDDLLEVENIKVVSASKNELKYKTLTGEEYPDFDIVISWDWKKTEKFDTSTYRNKGWFQVIKTDSGRYEMVVGFGD